MGENVKKVLLFFFIIFQTDFNKYTMKLIVLKKKNCPLINVKYVMKCNFLNKMIFTFRNTMIQYTSALYYRYRHIGIHISFTLIGESIYDQNPPNPKKIDLNNYSI